MMRTTRWLGIIALVLGLTACTEKPTPPPEDPLARAADSFVAESGTRLESLERALGQEERRRVRIVELAAGRTAMFRGLTVGDPHAIIEAQRVVLALEQDLAAKKAAEDARLKAPAMAEQEAKAVLLKAEEAQTDAERIESSMEGLLTTGSREKRCGSDGCGGSCNDCGWSQVCMGLFCRCFPDCLGKECGSDGCGGVCGTGRCSSDSYCTGSGQCESRPTETTCRADCRGVPAGPKVKTGWVKDHSGKKKRGWDPEKLQSLGDLETYMGALEGRRDELDGLIAGGAAMAQELEGTESALEIAKASLKETQAELSTGKKTLAAAKKAVKNLPEEEKANGEAQVATLTTSQTERQAKITQLKKEIAALKGKVKQLTLRIKKVARELPKIQEGRRRLGPELDRIEAGVATWKERKARITEKAAEVAQARAAVQAASETLLTAARSVDEAKTKLDVEYTPLLDAALETLRGLEGSAITEVLIGDAPSNGLNHESTFLLLLDDDGRLRRIQQAIEDLRNQRQIAWSKLTEEEREAYPNWPTLIETMDDYLAILAELDQVTQRARSLEDRLIEERVRILDAMAEDSAPTPAPEEPTS